MNQTKNHPYLALIIKPTYDCNMSCSYCSVEGQNPHYKMSYQTVDKIFERVTAFCGIDKPIYLIWHGGEPTLMGPTFYDYIGKMTKQYSRFKIINSLQTNALLLDNEFIDVISKYQFRISTSIDGSSEIHNKSRIDKDGNPTFDNVMKSVKALKEKGISVGAIMVLNKFNKDYMPKIYRFFNKEQIHIRINPVQLHGKARENYKNVAISPLRYGKEMIKIFDMWYYDPKTSIVIDPFRIIIGNIITGKLHSCDFRRQCHGEVMSISPEGGVYPCGQFNGNETYYLGKIHREGFEKIMESPKMEKLLLRVPENINRCSKCEFAEICNCGCTASAVCRNGDIMQPDYYCVGRKILFQHIIDNIQLDINKTRGIVSDSYECVV